MLATLLMSCATQLPVREVIFEDQMTMLQTRSIQSRTFELTDRIKAMRAVISTLQDLDFVIDNADSHVGIITATKMKSFHLHTTVKVNDTDSGRIIVRLQMSAGYPLGRHGYVNPITLAEGVYQEFFTSLEKNFFLGSS
jgi:hypothetical protein